MGCSPEARLHGAVAWVNLYLCLNWDPGKVAGGKARFWCQREGRTATGGGEAGWEPAPQTLCCLCSHGVSPISWDSVYKAAQTSPIWQGAPAHPCNCTGSLTHSLVCLLGPISIWTRYLVSNLKTKARKKNPKSQNFS